MAFSLQDAVLETSTAPGTGNASLNGATSSFFAFGDVYSNGDTFLYCIRNSSEREIGEGTYVSASDAVQRDTVLASTNGGSKVNFTGTCDVFVCAPTNNILVKDLSAEVAGPLHITTSDVSGGLVAATADDLVLEVNGSGGLTIVTPAANTASINFADPGSNQAGAITYNQSTNAMALIVNATSVATIDSNGAMYIGDTANANMTQGLTINQGTAVNEILALKGSDTAHGATHVAETDTIATFRRGNVTAGGLRIDGISESGQKAAVELFAHSDSPDSAKTTTADGMIRLLGRSFSGASTANVAANANIVTIHARVGGTDRTVAICDEDGDWFVDGTSPVQTYDDHDDIALLTAVRAMSVPQDMALELGWNRFVEDNIDTLSAGRIVEVAQDGGHFISLKRLHFLEIDAIRQMAGRILDLEARLSALEPC